jgi:hypothetical protein
LKHQYASGYKKNGCIGYPSPLPQASPVTIDEQSHEMNPEYPSPAVQEICQVKALYFLAAREGHDKVYGKQFN